MRAGKQGSFCKMWVFPEQQIPMSEHVGCAATETMMPVWLWLVLLAWFQISGLPLQVAFPVDIWQCSERFVGIGWEGINHSADQFGTTNISGSREPIKNFTIPRSKLIERVTKLRIFSGGGLSFWRPGNICMVLPSINPSNPTHPMNYIFLVTLMAPEAHEMNRGQFPLHSAQALPTRLVIVGRLMTELVSAIAEWSICLHQCALILH